MTSPPRVCFVTCRDWPDISESDALARDALSDKGVCVEAVPWNAPGARVESFAAAIFRSNWDYHHSPAAFVDWLAACERAGVRFWNEPALIRWNLTKRYLFDLAAAGVPVIPSVMLDGLDAPSVAEVMAERGWRDVVVKPVLSASAHGTILIRADQGEAVARAIEQGAIRRPLLIQPFVETIREQGEWSLIFIDGRFTHAVRKRPAAGDFRVQKQYGGVAVPAAAPDALVAAGHRALAALPRQTGRPTGPPLYARIDGVETAQGFLVMELELHEPALFFPMAPAAAIAFAEAVIRRLG